MINITIIGLGNVGSSLALLLLNNEHHIRLNVIDPNPDCEGAFLDLSHGMPLYQKKEFYFNDEDLFLNADFIYYSAGISNIHGASRLSTAKQNIQLSKDIFEGRNFRNNPFIIVITNPVDIISHSVLQYSNLTADKVIGTGTFLDSTRLSYYLSQIAGLKPSDIEATVLGEHGNSQVPAFSMSKVNGHPILNHDKFSKNDLETASELTKNAATKIRETQEATMFGISKCAEVLLDRLLSPNENSFTLSMMTNEHYRSLLLLEDDIYIGMPVTVRKGVVAINNNVELTDGELKKYQESAKILVNAMKKQSI